MKGSAGRTWHLAFATLRERGPQEALSAAPQEEQEVSRGSGPTSHLPPLISNLPPSISHHGFQLQPLPQASALPVSITTCPRQCLGTQVSFLQLVFRGTELAVVGEWRTDRGPTSGETGI